MWDGCPGNVAIMLGTRLILVRHGHSVAQEEGFAAGHDGCRGLSDLGRRQVTALADRLDTTGELGAVTALWSSVMPRAVETGDLLAAALGNPPRIRDCDVCEFHVGTEADGLSWAEISERWPLPDEAADQHHRRTPTTETWAEMTTRVARGLDRIVADHSGGTVVIATHGGVVGNVMMRMLRLSPRPHDDDRAWMNADNASITEFVHESVLWDNRPNGRWRLVRFNDAAHVNGIS